MRYARIVSFALIALGVWIGTASAATVLIEAEDDSLVTRTGYWWDVHGPTLHGGYGLENSTVGNSLTFEFTGLALTVGHQIGPNRGRFSVTIDDRTPVVVDSYNSKEAGGWLQHRTVVATDLANTLHTVTLVHLESASGRPYIAIDYFEFDTGAIEVEVDVRPDSDSNPVNLKSKGRLPVAVLTTDDFDASDVDDSTVRIGGVAPVHAALEDVDDDGDDDLLVHFQIPDLVEDGALDADSESLTLTGETYEGTPIRGTDAVRIVSKD